MRPDIVTIGNISSDWLSAIERDIAAGLVPPWIGAIVVAEHEGNVSLAFVERWKWIQEKPDRTIAKN